MQSALSLLALFGVFSPALMLPGPDFVAVVRNTIAKGQGAGILTALGVSLGISFYAGLSAVGLSTLLARVEWFEWVVRAGGAGFLGYLGVRLLTTRGPARHIENEPPRRPSGPDNPVLLGLMVNLTNPKAIVFFASVFGAAIKPGTHPWVIGGIVAAVGLAGLLWFSLVSMLTASTGLLVRLEDHQHWIERLAGLAFLGFAGRITYELIIAS
ncbi:LysE family translocator [Spiribacter pallidus]|uniref:LysE family transporter n=1 Tax=Spiribacter pallidus TaxID=1987936 RepID=A0ABV3TE20_9GAMM